MYALVISETTESNSPQTRFGFNATKLKTYYISDSELLASYTNRMWLNKIEPPHEYATANIVYMLYRMMICTRVYNTRK